MAKVTLKSSLPAIAAGHLGIFWLSAIFNAFSNSFLGGAGTFLISAPIVGTLLAFLAIEAVVCFEIPSDRANEWWLYLHESTGGALVIATLSLPWLMAVGSLCLMVLMSFLLGSGASTTPMDLLAKIPLVGPFAALFLSVSYLGVTLGLCLFLAIMAVHAVMRLIRAPRTGYVRNGAPDNNPRSRVADDSLEGGEFGAWESNRG